MKNSVKFISSTIVIALFIVIALASGNSNKKWEPNNKELFCGVIFEDSRYLEQIAMDIKSKTVLNDDGTYTSESGWDIVGENNKQSARDAGFGSTSEEEYNFKGTWEIVEPTEAMKGDRSQDKFKPTYIKYSCNNGKGGYALILCMENNLYLSTIDENGRDIFSDDEANTGMFSGIDHTDIESVAKYE